MATKIHIDDAPTRRVPAAPSEGATTAPTEDAQDSLDRYLVLEQIGEGGMGVVHRAYDPKLRREVALKMLRFDRRAGSGALQAENRILREARAMAQLSHPNVLPVYDVEHVGGLVYIAMEYVDGQNLSRWLRQQRRPWPEVLERFRQAGRGLLGAHQAGIIHRDFKPANVLLGNRGRVLVTDFGLAQAHDEADVDDAWSSGEGPDADVITASGEVVGTPAYMAPEQLRGDAIDARADQYAFCTALFEGLYGRRPFPLRDPLKLLEAKEHGEIVPDASVQVPTWILRIVDRGLRPDPDDRYPSMAELLDALDRDPALTRRRWGWIAAGVVIGVGGIGLRLATEPTDAPCPDPDSLVDEVWGDERRTAVRTALLATQQAYAAETAERVEAQLDAYSRAWAAGHVDACEATRVRDEQSAEAFDLRMACLGRHRAELDATVETLSAEVSDRTLMRAAGLVAALPPSGQCEDIQALRDRGRASDPALSMELEQQGERLARAKALQRAGRSEEAGELARSIEDRATVLDDPVLHGETMLLLGTLAETERDTEATIRWYELAFSDAVEGRHAPLAIMASMRLVHWLGIQQARTAEAEQWVLQARAWLRGRNDDDPLYAKLLVMEGELFQVAGRVDESRVAFERALDQLERQTDASGLADAHNTLGLALMAVGDPNAAEPHFMRVLELREELLGPHHPDVGRARENVGVTRYASGRLAPAVPYLESALEIYEQALGPDHNKVADVLGNLGSVRDDLGEHEEARELFERALAIREASEGTGTTHLVGLLGNLAGSLRNSGDYAAAAVHLRRAAALVEGAHGPGHPEHVALLTILGEVLMEADDRLGAREVLEQANDLRAQLPAEAALVSADTARALGHLLGREGETSRALLLLAEAIVRYRNLGEALDSRRGETLLDLGEVRLDTGDLVAARAVLEDAIGLLAAQRDQPRALARARFALARTLPIDAGDAESRVRARALARDALLGLDDDDPLRPRIRAWLDTHAH